MSNKLYDTLKRIALTLPLVITFITAIMKIWNIPYAVEIGLSLNALNALIAGIVKIANDNFYKEQVQTNINYDTQEELIEEGVVENED
jgi:hypothetical protein